MIFQDPKCLPWIVSFHLAQYAGKEVPPKFDGLIPDGSTINRTLNPWVSGVPNDP
jgi:hypothetical protein